MSLPAPADTLVELVVSPDGRIVECGPAAARLLGLADESEARGVHLSLFCRDAERLAEALSAAAVTGRLERWDADLMRLDGAALPAVVDLVASFDEPRALTSVRVSIKPVRAWAAAVDEPVRPRAGRDQAGQLAHELNNLLAIISGHSECLLTTPPGAPVDGSSVDAIQRAVVAAAQVAARVRALGRAPDAAARGVDIDSLLSAVQADLRRTFGHRLAVAVQPAPHPWTVAIDRAVVEYALAAIAADAINAMPHGGTLTFRTMNVEIGQRRPAVTAALRPGRYVRVEVTYLTAGVATPVQPSRRATDPQGPSGLDALRQAGGRVLFDTDGVRVASVAVLLPSDGVTVLRPRVTLAPAAATASLLLIEKDPTLQRLLQTVLKGHGYRVATATTAEEAAAVLEQQSIDVLLTDHIPVEGPHDAARWLAGYPLLRVLGTSETVSRALSRADGGHRVAVVARPLAADQVAEAVRTLLQATPGANGLKRAAGAPLAALALKSATDEPIHPLEAS
ncbi:MAG: hypothetical protein ABI880_14585 [Acidobacteriota bacterium]